MYVQFTSCFYGVSIDPVACRKNPTKNKIVITNCQHLLLGENYTEIKAWDLKFGWSDPYFSEKLRWNASVTAKIFLENLVRNISKEKKFWNNI